MKDNVYIMENMLKIRINSSGTAKAKGLSNLPLVSEFSIAPECKSQCFSGVSFFKSKAAQINFCAAFCVFKGAGSIGAIPARPKGLVEGQVCKKSQDDLGTGLNTFSFEELHNILSLDKEQRVSGPKPHVIES